MCTAAFRHTPNPKQKHVQRPKPKQNKAYLTPKKYFTRTDYQSLPSEHRYQIQKTTPETFITNAGFLLGTSSIGNGALQILREDQALHSVYRLRDDSLDETVGEAVFSDSADEIRLHGIFVKPKHRGKGHGATLMEAVISLGDAKAITLCTGLRNVGFFRRFGFQVTEIGDSLISMERKP